MAVIEELPMEVLINICSFLKPREVSALSQVNKLFNSLASDVLTSIDHLKLHRFKPDQAIEYLTKYRGIRCLDLSEYSGCFSAILNNERSRNDFGLKLASACTKIDTFIVPDVVGVEFVNEYINYRYQCLMVSNEEPPAILGIKNLQVFTLKTHTEDLVQLFQCIKDIVQVSREFKTLSLGPIAGKLPDDPVKRISIDECWTLIGKRVKSLKITNYDDYRHRDVNDLKSLIVPKLEGLTSLSLEVLTTEDIRVITINNPDLISLKCDYLTGGFKYISRLKQLKELSIEELQNSPTSPSKEDVNSVFDGLKDNLIKLNLGLINWTRQFMAINKCVHLQEIKLKVSLIEEPQDLIDFRASIPEGVDLKIVSRGSSY